MFSLADSIKSTLEQSITSVSATFSDKKDTRSRKLSVEKTIHLLIGADGSSLAKELHRVGIDATPAAVSQRRANIPPDVFQDVFNHFNKACKDSETFRGYRYPSSRVYFFRIHIKGPRRVRRGLSYGLLQQRHARLLAGLDGFGIPQAGLDLADVAGPQQQHTEPRLADASADGLGKLAVQQHLVEGEHSPVVAPGGGQLAV